MFVFTKAWGYGSLTTSGTDSLEVSTIYKPNIPPFKDPEFPLNGSWWTKFFIVRINPRDLTWDA